MSCLEIFTFNGVSMLILICRFGIWEWTLPTVHRGNPDDENASLVRFRRPVIWLVRARGIVVEISLNNVSLWFGIFFRITLNLLYVQYFFSNYVELPSKYRTFGIFSWFSAAFFWWQQCTFGGKHLPAIPNPLTYGFEKCHTYGNSLPIGCS